MALKVTEFGGIVPRKSERLIPDNAAQVATNCILSSGELVPLRRAKLEYESAKAGPLLSIYRAHEAGKFAWLAWNEDVDVVKTTLAGPAKFCFTGDGEPRITNLASAISGLGNDYPHTAYTLGTPKPTAAPSVAPSGGSSTAESRYYAYSFYTSWDSVEMEGAISPLSALITGKVDDTWAITGMDASPTSGGTVSGVYSAGYTTFTDSLPTWLRTGEEVVLGGATVAVTSTPSATTFKVSGDYSAVTAWTRKAAFPGTFYKRLYRTAGTTAQFQLVADQQDGGAAWASATTYNDSLTGSQILGDELISSDWDMPPADLAGLIMLPSGAVAGFTGNQVCFSEPDQPHAWPSTYRLRADQPVSAIASFGSGVAVGTNSRPYIIDGIDPGQQTMRDWAEVLPCLSKRSMFSLGDMAGYASNVGCVTINSGGASIMTTPYFTDREWGDLAPETMVSAVAGRRLYMRYDISGVVRTLVFNLSGDTPYLTDANFNANELYADDVTGGLYFSDGSDINEFDPSDGYNISQDWMSREYVLPSPRNLGAARVSFQSDIPQAQIDTILAEIAAVNAANAALIAAGDAGGAWGGSAAGTIAWGGSQLEEPPETPTTNEVTFILYGDGVPVATLTVTNTKAFRLPKGYMAERVAFRVQSECLVHSVEVGRRPQDLASV